MRRSTCATDALAVDVTEEDILSIEVKGNAFCRNMVRVIAGTLVDVGRNSRTIASVKALRSGDRSEAGMTAPARRLTLDEVFYADTIEGRWSLLRFVFQTFRQNRLP